MTYPDTWRLGRYTVIRREHPPEAVLYVIMRAGVVVGRSASNPSADQCEAIERFTKTGMYVDESAEPKRYSYRLRGVAVQHRGRPSTSGATEEK